MRRFRTKRGVAILAGLLLVGLSLARPGANRLRTRIVASISLALGRPVEVASVNLRFLPPGFDLENFIVRDDPAFSAEPVIRAQEVTARLRVSSLLRGRLEIARLSLTEPSLNLVRNAAGQWNLEGLLRRAAETTVAPTSKTKSETRPGFPYIESSDARINLKFEHEKLPYALTEADFALWQDSENSWGVRMEAKPVRTDFNLTDTGIVNLAGSWQRSATLHDTPLKFTMQWNHAQLGQLTKLFYGDDKGWRGAILFSSTISGTPASLDIATQTSVQDFRRYDIVGGGPLLLTAHCAGHYSTTNRQVSNLDCRGPVGNGELALEGGITGLLQPSAYNLSFSAHDVPVQGLVSLIRHANGNVPRDLIATGKMNGSVNVSHVAGQTRRAVWEGEGDTSGLRLASKSTKADLTLDRIHFVLAAAATKNRAAVGPAVEIGPINVPLGRPNPVTVHAKLSRTGYNVQIQGDAQIRRLLQTAETIGLAVPRFSADGPAKLDLQVAGIWSGFPAPDVSGRAVLHGVSADLKDLNEPLEIESATLAIAPDGTKVSNLTASLAGSTWRGSLEIPQPCPREVKCSVRFNLAADKIDTMQLRQAAVAGSNTGMWYRFLPTAKKPAASYLSTLRASGRLTANRLLIHQLAATHVSTDVTLEEGKLHLSNLRADLLGGTHQGEWTANFTTQPPSYTGTGTVYEGDLDTLADTMNDGWITGTASAAYDVSAKGDTLAQLLVSATGNLDVSAHDGGLPHILLTAGTVPLSIERFSGRFVIRAGKLELADGKLLSSGGAYAVTGSASLTNSLDLNLIRNSGRGFNISGSLAEPHVEPAVFPEAQAALKP